MTSIIFVFVFCSLPTVVRHDHFRTYVSVVLWLTLPPALQHHDHCGMTVAGLRHSEHSVTVLILMHWPALGSSLLSQPANERGLR